MARRKSTRGRVLVSRTGRKNTKNINDYKERIRNDSNLTPLEKRSKLADLDIYIEERAKKNRQFSGKRLTTTGFEGWEAETDLDRMFANLGMSPEEMAYEYDLDADELADPNNWKNGIFKGQYKLNWTYSGKVMEKI